MKHSNVLKFSPHGKLQVAGRKCSESSRRGVNTVTWNVFESETQRISELDIVLDIF